MQRGVVTGSKELLGGLKANTHSDPTIKECVCVREVGRYRGDRHRDTETETQRDKENIQIVIR